MRHKVSAGRDNILTGKCGEDIAEIFLKNKGFKIIERNYRSPFGEIDIVAKDRNATVFIEVKTKISKSFGPPLLEVTESKKKSIIKNAVYYLKKFNLLDRDARIDVVSINLNNEGKFEKLEHIKSAVWIEGQ